MGVDGEIYTVSPGSVVVLPEIHAKNMHKKAGEIISDYELVEEFDFWEEYRRRNLDFGYDFDELDNKDLTIRQWAELALQQELKKPDRDINRVAILRMLSQGINPLTLNSNSNPPPSSTLSTSPSPSPSSTISGQASPTGLCSPFSNTVFPQNFDENINDVEYKSKLETVFETYGLEKKTTLTAYRVRGLKEIDLGNYAILDYEYTRVEPHPEFLKLLRDCGYDERDCYANFLFEEYRCPNHPKVFKPTVDFEKGGYIDDYGVKKGSFRLMAGRKHPIKKLSDIKRVANFKMRKLEHIFDYVSKMAVSYRVFDSKLTKVKNSDLALMWFVFTVPDSISRGLRNATQEKVNEVFNKAIRGTLKFFLRKYLKKHENVPLRGDFKFGGFKNLHIWSSSQPTKPHYHVHVCLPNFVIYNGEFIRFSPYIPKQWLDELKKIWMREFEKALKKDRDVYIWCDHYFFDEHDFFNIYVSYTRMTEKGKIAHHLRYNMRKALIDLNEFFYSGVEYEGLLERDREFLRYLVDYSNRVSDFGFLKKWKKYFEVEIDEIEEMAIKAKEKEEYCPICKERMEYVGVVTLDEVVKHRRLLVLWWFDRRMNIEVWKGAMDVIDNKSGRGY